MLAKKYRLVKRGSFSYVYRNGKRCSTALITMQFIKSGSLKIGFSVSNKVGKACVRNLIKRRLRAISRELLPSVKGKFQIVFVAKNDIVNADFKQIKKDMLYLFNKLVV